jgi:hypothetical protein
MMGERRVRQEALFYEFSLEQHVPEKHLLRYSVIIFVSDAGGVGTSALSPTNTCPVCASSRVASYTGRAITGDASRPLTRIAIAADLQIDRPFDVVLRIRRANRRSLSG